MNTQDDLKNADAALRENEEIAALTSGISMRPMLREHKDIVIIRRADKKLKRNDVPLYSRPNSDKFVLHRILKVTDGGYIIRGDNLYFNEFVKDEQIIGVLKAFYRSGKYYDCEKSTAYKLYKVYVRLSYPFRRLWKFKIRPVLSRIKHFLSD